MLLLSRLERKLSTSIGINQSLLVNFKMICPQFQLEERPLKIKPKTFKLIHPFKNLPLSNHTYQERCKEELVIMEIGW